MAACCHQVEWHSSARGTRLVDQMVTARREGSWVGDGPLRSGRGKAPARTVKSQYSQEQLGEFAIDLAAAECRGMVWLEGRALREAYPDQQCSA